MDIVCRVVLGQRSGPLRGVRCFPPLACAAMSRHSLLDLFPDFNKDLNEDALKAFDAGCAIWGLETLADLRVSFLGSFWR